MTKGQDPEDQLVMPEGGPFEAGGRYQALCLSGGGYRGLYTAILLEELERRAGKQLRECFDLIAGTSIGGILAIGLAAGIPAHSLRLSFEKHGSAIFPKTNRILGLKIPRLSLPAFRHRYSNDGLRETIKTILNDPGEKLTMTDAGPSLLIPSVNATTDDAAVFRTSSSDQNLTLVDAALATSAAPTYFPEHAIGDENFVDGELIANAPDLLAISDGLQAGFRREDIHVLSLGTVETIAGRRIRPPSGTGYVTGAKRLFELTLDAQQRLALNESRALLGSNYLRIDAIASPDQMRDLGLDRIDKQSRKTLSALATASIRDQLGSDIGRLRGMLGRRAEWVM